MTCPHAAHTHLTPFQGGEFCTNCGYLTPPSGPGAEYHWWAHPAGEVNRDTLALVAAWMAEEAFSATDVAYMVAKPWKFSVEFQSAVRATAPETESPDLLRALQQSLQRAHLRRVQ